MSETHDPRGGGELDAAAHARGVLAVREQREAGLRDPMGWLSLVGLHWLAPGRTAFGADPGNAIVLRAEEGEVPPTAGTFTVADGAVTLEAAAGLTVEGSAPDGPIPMLPDDADEGPTIVELASLRLYVIERGAGRLAIRVKDLAAPALRAFTGLDYFAPDPAWRVVGRLEPAEPGATIRVPDIVGDLLDEPTPGDLVFEVGGEQHRLHAQEASPGHLWLIFGDETNGAETYGGGRFLVSGPVRPDLSVDVDFNLTYNPPCVFSPYATCPLPPAGNRLPIRVPAGERMYQLGGAHA